MYLWLKGADHTHIIILVSKTVSRSLNQMGLTYVQVMYLFGKPQWQVVKFRQLQPKLGKHSGSSNICTAVQELEILLGLATMFVQSFFGGQSHNYKL